MNKELIKLLFVSCLSYGLDILTSKDRYNKCINIKAQLLLFFHHIFISYLNFGAFFMEDKKLLLGIIIGIILTNIHWSTNDNKCILTQEFNSMCEITGGLRSITDLLGIKSGPNRIYQKIYMVLIMIICIKKIYL